MVEVCIYTPGAARRSNGDFPDDLPRRTAAVLLSAEGRNPGTVSSPPGTCGSHVSSANPSDIGAEIAGGEMRIAPGTALVSLVHLVANALLLLLGYYWLGLSESNAFHLAWSFLVIAVFVATAIWLHGATFVYFDGHEDRLQNAAKLALRHLPPLSVLTLISVVIYVLLWRWTRSFAHAGFLISSYVTMTLRIPATPASVIRTLNGIFWFVRWIVLPVCLIPVFANVAKRGWPGFYPKLLRAGKKWVYRIEVAILILCAIWLPFRLFAWRPEFKAFALQMASFLLRAGLAYLLFVAGLLAIERLTSAGRPDFSQPSRAPSP